MIGRRDNRLISFSLCNEFRRFRVCNNPTCQGAHVVPTTVPWSNPNQPVPLNPMGIVCQQFTQGTCRFGNECRNVHVLNINCIPRPHLQQQQPPPPEPLFKVCFSFHNNEFCNSCPDNCELNHVVETSVAWTKFGSTIPRNLRGVVLCEAFQTPEGCRAGVYCNKVHVLFPCNVPRSFEICLHHRNEGICSFCPNNCKLDHIEPTAVSWTKLGYPLPQPPVGVLCNDFHNGRNCKNGPNCNYVHVVNASKVLSQFTLCTAFRDQNFCSKCPDECTKLHVKPTLVSGTHLGDVIPSNLTTRLCYEFRNTAQCVNGSDCSYLHLVRTADVFTKADRETFRICKSFRDTKMCRAWPHQCPLSHVLPTIVAWSKPTTNQSASETPQGIRCQLFDQLHHCSHGKNCRYVHELPQGLLPSLICLPLRDKGFCSNCPDKCGYHHLLPTNVSWTKSKKAIKASQTTEELCQRFRDSQLCTEGSECRYLHVFLDPSKVPTKPNLAAATDPRPSTTNINPSVGSTAGAITKPPPPPPPPLKKRNPFEKEEDLDDDTINPWLLSELKLVRHFNWNTLSEVRIEPAVCYTFSINFNQLKTDNIRIAETKESRDIKIADKHYFDRGIMRTAHEFSDLLFPHLQYVAMVFIHTKAHNLEAYIQDAKDKLKAIAQRSRGATGITSVSIYELTDRPSIDYFKYVAIEPTGEYLSMHLN